MPRAPFAHRSSRRWAGFTLIELLVVIAVLVLLAAISFPVFGALQERGRTTACANNLRQIATALLAYAGEHDGTFPIACATIPHGQTDSETGKPGWTEQLESCLGSSGAVYVCPSSSRVLAKNKEYSYCMGSHAA